MHVYMRGGWIRSMCIVCNCQGINKNTCTYHGSGHRSIGSHCLLWLLWSFVLVTVHVGVHAPWCACRGQRTAVGIQFSLSIMGSRGWPQVTRLEWQALLSAEPSHLSTVFWDKVCCATQLAWNSVHRPASLQTCGRFSWLCLPSAAIIVLLHHTWLWDCFLHFCFWL